MKHYVLDACALIALLRDESGAEKVAEAMQEVSNGEATAVMNKINLLEVYYDVYRIHGKEQADRMLVEFKKMPCTITAEISDKLFEQAGRLKASYRISLADAIALSEASLSQGILLTADHHEMDVIEQKEKIAFNWIR